MNIIEAYESYIKGPTRELFKLIEQASQYDLDQLEIYIHTKSKKKKNKPIQQSVWFEFKDSNIPWYCPACSYRVTIHYVHRNPEAYDSITGAKIACGFRITFICTKCEWAQHWGIGRGYYADNIQAPPDWKETKQLRHLPSLIYNDGYIISSRYC